MPLFAGRKGRTLARNARIGNLDLLFVTFCGIRIDEMAESSFHKPDWLKVQLPQGESFEQLQRMVRGSSLVTVCQAARCPNMGECWSHGAATFMLCGDACTRACAFCATRTAKPRPLDPDEPDRVAEAVAALRLRHTLITMVTRDDLPDGGAAHMAAAIRAIRRESPQTIIEVLVSDFRGNEEALARVMEACPHIFNHNVETVERLTPLVRFRARYRLSLLMLRRAREMAPGRVVTKSGLMLGLGETWREVEETMDHLLEQGVSVLTMGQYLRPTPRHLPVIRYWRPDEFEHLKQVALRKGFRHVASGPLIRSSHHDAAFRPEPEIIQAIETYLRNR